MIVSKKLIIINFTILFSLFSYTTFGCGKMDVSFHESINFQSKKKAFKPGERCINFLKWYVHNIYSTGGLKYLNLPENKNEMTPYSINFENVRQYKAKLKKTGFVSETFLNTIQMRLDSAATYLKTNPQVDGPVDGLETDMIMQLGEPELLTDHLNNLSIKTEKYLEKFCYVTITVSRYLDYMFVLSKQNGQWQIENISRRLKN